ncbi:hypothetical protein [Bacterioplanoides sp.]|uniref:hypothetical protein n=1 Tax=Bacterioplanoides sp. TaxID=2066072 RepID=UPI003B5D0433
MTETEKAAPGRPHAIPDERFFQKIQDRLDSNPHETIDDIAYTWLFQEVGGTRKRAKELLSKFRAGYLAKLAEDQPEVPGDILAMAADMANRMATETYLMSRKECAEELKAKDETHNIQVNRLQKQNSELERQGFADEERLQEKDSRIAELEGNNVQLCDDLEECRTTLTRVIEQNAELNRGIHGLQETATQQKIRLDDQAEELKSRKGEIETLSHKLDDARGTCNDLSQQLQASKSSEALTRQAETMIRSQLGDANQKVVVLEKENRALSARLHQMELDKAVAESQVAAANAAASAAEAMIEETRNLYLDQIASLKKQVEGKKTGKGETTE